MDHLSPKICYFVNETVTNKYQIIVILCKSADDSYRLVNLLQHKVNTQGHYRAHSQWLQNGSFSSTGEQTTPKAKHRLGYTRSEVVSTPKLSRKLSWGRRSGRKVGESWTPPPSKELNKHGLNNRVMDTSQEEATAQEPIYVNDFIPQISRGASNDVQRRRRISVISAKQLSTKIPDDTSQSLSNDYAVLDNEPVSNPRPLSRHHNPETHRLSQQVTHTRQPSQDCRFSFVSYNTGAVHHVTEQEMTSVVMRGKRKPLCKYNLQEVCDGDLVH